MSRRTGLESPCRPASETTCNETRRPPDNGGPSCSCRGGGGRLPSATAGPLCPERDPAPAYHRDKPDSSARGAVPNLQTTWKGRCPLRRVPSQRSRRLACRWACRRPSPRTGAPYMYTWHMAHGTWHMAHGTWHMAVHMGTWLYWHCGPVSQTLTTLHQVRVPCQGFMQGFLPTALSYCKDNAMGTL